MAIILKSELTSSLDAVDIGKANIFFDGSDEYIKYKRSDGTINVFSVVSGNMGGDLSGSFPNPSVAKIQGFSVSSSTPTSNQALIWNASTSRWAATTLNSNLTTNSSSVSGSTVSNALDNLYQRLDFDNISTSSYTWTLSDVGKKKRFLTTCTASLPTTASVAWVLGSVIYGRQVVSGTALVFLTGSSGVVINQTKFKTSAQHSEFALHYVGNNSWDLTGDLTT